ncbi:hypothetical protein [Paenibacillus protaetiae]|uniref:PilZ domain-containing protein n=1 Tax=Paenibacillus protaetiae TaxID=2509456 RepID=A0A4P6EYG6_9BACL|nr:hypothetical protein [Paenibacillus protaetiae]QAY68142.1 hypothetical protein ET464_18955 [Paenibacillus protaetiae]
MVDIVRSRAFTRLKFSYGLKAELRLADDQGILLTDASAAVIVMHMNPDGLGFLSGLRLPVHRGYLVDLRFSIGGVLLQVWGKLTSRKTADNQYEYMMDFHPPYKLRPLLVRILNQELLRQNPADYKIHSIYRRLNEYRMRTDQKAD